MDEGNNGDLPERDLGQLATVALILACLMPRKEISPTPHRQRPRRR